MKKRYIVSVNNKNTAKDEAFAKFLDSKKYRWWHWLSHTWLVIDTSGNSNVSGIRDAVREIFSEHNLIVEVNGNHDTWSGYGPNLEDKNMFKWLHENWKD